MVMLGGYTRLTDSGLSIVEWQPVSGTIPPVSEMQWQEEFEKYKQSPEYRLVNYGMSIDEFQHIFLVEYFHRLVGRITGMIFLIPFIFFFVKRMISRDLVLKLAGVFLLGVVQGLMGWLMVKSGLSINPHVSQYRLAAHLGFAVVIYSMLFLLGLGLWNKKEKLIVKDLQLRKLSFFITILIFIQIISGAFVAGLDAGLVFNSFPLMDDRIIPAGVLALSPWYKNFFENIITVQFNHRIIAFILAGFIFFFWVKLRKADINSRVNKAANILLVAVFVQIVLGILTLVNIVPLSLALMHQVFAIILLSISLFISNKFYNKF